MQNANDQCRLQFCIFHFSILHFAFSVLCGESTMLTIEEALNWFRSSQATYAAARPLDEAVGLVLAEDIATKSIRRRTIKR